MWCRRRKKQQKLIFIKSCIKYFLQYFCTIWVASHPFYWLETVKLIINSHDRFIWLLVINLADLPTHSPSSTLNKRAGAHEFFCYTLSYTSYNHYGNLYLKKLFTTFIFMIIHISKFLNIIPLLHRMPHYIILNRYVYYIYIPNILCQNSMA